MNIFGITISNSDVWLLGIAGVGLTWLVVHRLAIERDKRNAFRAAAWKFRSSVLGALSGLYPIPVDWPNEGYRIDKTLRAAFPVLQSAVAEFRYCLLSVNQKQAFDRAWAIYRIGPEGREVDVQNYTNQYLAFSNAGEAPPDVKAIFHTNVFNLLSFADED